MLPEQHHASGQLADHDQDGQNVLFGDGHADWQTNPFCGTQHDNIYTGREDTSKPTPTRPLAVRFVGCARTPTVGASGPYDVTDSILLPTISN